MRKLFVLLLLFSFTAHAQIMTPVNGYGFQYKRSKSDSTFHIPHGSTPSLNNGVAEPGAAFWNTSDSSLYMWTGTQFIKINSDSTTYGAGYGIKVSGYVISVDSSLMATLAHLYKVVDSLTAGKPTVTTQTTTPGSILVSTTTNNVYDVVTPAYLTADSLKTLTNGYTWHLPLYQTSQTKDVYLATNLAVYNASELQGVRLKPVQPHDGEVPTYDEAQGQYIPKPGGSGIVVGFTPANSTDNTYQIGTVSADDNYLYHRTSDGTWKKIAWGAF